MWDFCHYFNGKINFIPRYSGKCRNFISFVCFFSIWFVPLLTDILRIFFLYISLLVAISSCWMLSCILYCSLYIVMHTLLINSSLSFFSNDHCAFFFSFIWPSLSLPWNNCLLLTRSALNANAIIQALIFKQNPRVAFVAGLIQYLPYAAEIIYCLSLFYCVLIWFYTAWVWYGTVSIIHFKINQASWRSII